MHAHVLTQIVVSTEVFAAIFVRALVRYIIDGISTLTHGHPVTGGDDGVLTLFVRMDAANVTLQVFASLEALIASGDLASVTADILGDVGCERGALDLLPRRTYLLDSVLRHDNRRGGDATPSAFLREIRHRHGRRQPGPLHVERGEGPAVGRIRARLSE